MGERQMKHNDIRCTPPELVAEVAELIGVEKFTLDVAASPNNAVAETYYALENGEDGLILPWSGHVWCNPPYSDIGPWVESAWYQCMNCDSITMLLPANKTEQPWWQNQIEPALQANPWLKALFLRGRRKFLMPDGSPIYARVKDGSLKLNAKGQPVIGSPSFGLVVLHWRP